MRKKIILGIVILAVIVAAIFLVNNFAVIKTMFYGKRVVNINVTKITDEQDVVYYTPGLEKLNKLESLRIVAHEETNYKYLSKMNDLQELELFYLMSYCGRLETLPELPNLKKLTVVGGVKDESNFTLSDEYEYNFSSIETLEIEFFTTIDCDALKHFENLSTLKISALINDLTEEQIEELQSRGITVEIR